MKRATDHELLREPSDTQKGQQDVDNQSDAENDGRNRGHFDVENMSQVKRHAPTSSKARPSEAGPVDNAAAEPT